MHLQYLIDMPVLQYSLWVDCRPRSKVTLTSYSSSNTALLSKYGFFWLQKLKTVTSCKPNSPLLHSPSLTNGWHHGGLPLSWYIAGLVIKTIFIKSLKNKEKQHLVFTEALTRTCKGVHVGVCHRLRSDVYFGSVEQELPSPQCTALNLCCKAAPLWVTTCGWFSHRSNQTSMYNWRVGAWGVIRQLCCLTEHLLYALYSLKIKKKGKNICGLLSYSLENMHGLQF